MSGFFWQGTQGRIYRLLAQDRFRALVTSTTLLELEDVLSRPKFTAELARIGSTAHSLIQDYQLLAEFVDPVVLSEAIGRDRDDQHILACAVGGHADFIVTGDRDLLVLEHYAGIPIVTPAEFLELLDSSPSS